MTLGAFYVLTSLRFWTFGDECTLAERLDEKLRCFLAFKTFYDLPRAGFAAFSTCTCIYESSKMIFLRNLKFVLFSFIRFLSRTQSSK
jgi:hypothetical protein